MRLYAGRTTDFIQDATRNTVARRLETAFVEHFRYRPSPGEVRSWEESLVRLSLVIGNAGLTDHGIFLEYQLPLTSRRLDALLTGLDGDREENAVIVELKQWQRAEPCDAEGMVSTWVGGDRRDTLHPSVQAGQYRDYLADMHSAFHDGARPVELSACAYLHNYLAEAGDPIFSPKFSAVLERTPLFGTDSSAQLEEFLVARLERGCGMPVLDKIEHSKVRPSKKLLEHVAAVVRGEPRFVLLDEQRVVFERTLAEAKRGFMDRKKRVLLIQGGPGTGKSVLAANLLGQLSKEGLNAQYATGSRAFTTTLRKIVGRRAAAQLTYFNSYADAEPGSVDVLICDEAHRIRERSVTRYTPRVVRDTLSPQIDELLRAAKVSVFFIDDRQIVKPGEIGSTTLIRSKAVQVGATLHEYRLEAQFRCAGSDGFVNWIDNTLGIHQTANQIWNAKSESFDFRIYRSADDLEKAIRERAEAGASARLVAGFCWPWSQPREDGQLVDDIIIDDFRRPWNARPEATHLAPGIPKATLWAYDAAGINQVGCVYTAQGFEFDYVGLIWGRDLQFDQEQQRWIADPTNSRDTVVRGGGDRFEDYIRNTYRVLLSRGLKGCYVYFQDSETAKFLLSRAEGLTFETFLAAEQVEDKKVEVGNVVPLRRISRSDLQPFNNAIPVVDLAIAAGEFGEFQLPDPDSVEWVSVPDGVRPSMDLFVARVVGESMNKVVPSGSWCLFRLNPAGTRNGRIVVAQLRNYTDPEGGGAFTIKRYESVKQIQRDEEVTNILIRLKPESNDATYRVIEVTQDDESVRVIAELLRVL
jgi:hypothetical protein